MYPVRPEPDGSVIVRALGGGHLGREHRREAAEVGFVGAVGRVGDAADALGEPWPCPGGGGVSRDGEQEKNEKKDRGIHHGSSERRRLWTRGEVEFFRNM